MHHVNHKLVDHSELSSHLPPGCLILKIFQNAFPAFGADEIDYVYVFCKVMVLFVTKSELSGHFERFYISPEAIPIFLKIPNPIAVRIFLMFNHLLYWNLQVWNPIRVEVVAGVNLGARDEIFVNKKEQRK